MKVYVKEYYKAELTEKVCADIAERLGYTGAIELEYSKGKGRYVLFDLNGVRHYVIVSRKATDSRDAFLNQYVPTVLSRFVEDNTLNKRIDIYLLYTGSGVSAQYIIDGFKMAKTLGMKILNEDELHLTINPYSSFEEWKRVNDRLRKTKPTNDPSYAVEDEDGNGYTLFGKLYGANGKDSAMTACLLAQIARPSGKKVHFVEVSEHGTDSVNAADRKLMEYYGVCFDDGRIVLNENETLAYTTCRRQSQFIYNLFTKYGKKRCALCECNIDSNIIASHIHRITDIDASPLSDEEKRRQATDADNGLWLCANHDKLFENGQITISESGQLIINPALDESQKEYITSITTKYAIDEKYMTDNLKEYLKKHNRRINLGCF